MRKLIVMFMLLLCVIVASGCQAKTNMTLDVQRNGSGTVQLDIDLDQEAADAVPNTKDLIQVKDLESRGWKITINDKPGEKHVARRLRAEYAFGTIAEGNAALRQLSQQSGPFSQFTIKQDRSIYAVNTTFSGSIDLVRGIDSIATAAQSPAPPPAAPDAPPTTAPPAPTLGLDLDELKSGLGFDPAQSFPVTVTVNLPGGTKSQSPKLNAQERWDGVYGASTPVQKTSRAIYFGPKLMIAIGVLAIIGFGAVMAFWQPTLRPSKRSRVAKDVTPRL